MEDILARFTGKSADLLQFEEVRRKLRASGTVNRGLHDIPLDAIVGSVGRYGDFTRSFLPRRDSDAERWARVQRMMTGAKGLEPIKVYKLGDAYFVLDGNHRVSVARQMGENHIQADVTEVQTRVPFSPYAAPDELIIKAEMADFLEQTHLDQTRPAANLLVTAPGQYARMLSHIESQRVELERQGQRPVTLEAAAAHWYDTTYEPVVKLLRERGMLRDFPGRTETDLYVYIWEHREEIARNYGWQVDPKTAAADLVQRRSSRTSRRVARLGERLAGAITPEPLEDGPAPGQWRREAGVEQVINQQTQRALFTDVLVPVNGAAEGWKGLEQALVLVRREGSRLHGLHVVPNEQRRRSPEAEAVRQQFDATCAEAGLAGNLLLDVGEVADQITDRARWADLVVVNLAHPPGPQPIARLRSGFRTLVRRCPRPILAVPQVVTPLDTALLAYDASPKAEEALFVAAYLALRWQIQLVVLTVLDDGHTGNTTLGQARRYLETHAVQATCVSATGPVAATILATAAEHSSNLLIMGGYGHTPMLEMVLGSEVDIVLRMTTIPVLMCR
jgi:nucleotide-binding universal stress UspA family protein